MIALGNIAGFNYLTLINTCLMMQKKFRLQPVNLTNFLLYSFFQVASQNVSKLIPCRCIQPLC